jgi:hypothetical protein
MAWVCAWLCKLQKKRCTRLAAASDKVYQLLVHGQWFSPGTTASSTTKTGRHTESGIKHQKSNQINSFMISDLLTAFKYENQFSLYVNC